MNTGHNACQAFERAETRKRACFERHSLGGFLPSGEKPKFCLFLSRSCLSSIYAFRRSARIETKDMATRLHISIHIGKYLSPPTLESTILRLEMGWPTCPSRSAHVRKGIVNCMMGTCLCTELQLQYPTSCQNSKSPSLLAAAQL